MTLEQQTLDGTHTTTIVDGKPLTRRQQLAWNLIRQHGSVTADEVGAAVHAMRGKHGEHRRCRWCAETGKQVLNSKPLRKLAVRKRTTGRWHQRDPGGQAQPRGPQLVALPGETFHDIFGGGDANDAA